MTVRRFLLVPLVAAGLVGCVADPYYTAYDPYYPPYNTAYDPYYGAPPPPPPGYGPAPGTNQALGTVGGAVAGGLIGSTIGSGSGQVAATVGGALLGGLLGGTAGRNLDERNRQAAWAAQQRAFATNTVSTWGAPGAPYYGTVRPLRTYVLDGRYCREYLHTVFIDGRPQEARGAACQGPDGTWQVLN